MATGKTTVGRRLAAAVGRSLVDSDEQLTARTGLSANDLARRDGIDALHALEAEVLLEALAGSAPTVIAAAASTIEDARCRAALADAFVVWLRADVSVLVTRVREQSHRPLDDDVAQQLRDQAARRDPLFAEVADLVDG